MKQLFTSKKGGIFDDIGALGIGIATLAIVLVVVFLLLSNVASNTQVAADGNASAAVSTLQGSAETIPNWVPLIVITVIGSILLGLVMLFRRSS